MFDIRAFIHVPTVLLMNLVYYQKKRNKSLVYFIWQLLNLHQTYHPHGLLNGEVPYFLKIVLRQDPWHGILKLYTDIYICHSFLP